MLSPEWMLPAIKIKGIDSLIKLLPNNLFFCFFLANLPGIKPVKLELLTKQLIYEPFGKNIYGYANVLHIGR
jgi:hypothetical protein